MLLVFPGLAASPPALARRQVAGAAQVLDAPRDALVGDPQFDDREARVTAKIVERTDRVVDAGDGAASKDRDDRGTDEDTHQHREPSHRRRLARARAGRL